jgi:hypothetical protein
VHYKVLFPIKDVNPNLPFPQDNTFNGFLYDADEFDASLIMLYLAAKLPVLPWLPDTLPPFTGKLVPNIASNIAAGTVQTIGDRTVEIPIYFNGNVNGAQAVAIDAAEGTKILDVKTPARTDYAWVEAANSEHRLALAAAGAFQPGDIIATLVVEADNNGDVVFRNVRFGEVDKGVMKLNITGSGVETGASASLNLSQNSPNPFVVHSNTTITYSIPQDGSVNIRVFDVLGREIRTLVNTNVKAGTYSTEWDGVDAFGNPVESGVYYYQINAGGQTRTMSMQVRK